MSIYFPLLDKFPNSFFPWSPNSICKILDNLSPLYYNFNLFIPPLILLGFFFPPLQSHTFLLIVYQPLPDLSAPTLAQYHWLHPILPNSSLYFSFNFPLPSFLSMYTTVELHTIQQNDLRCIPILLSLHTIHIFQHLTLYEKSIMFITSFHISFDINVLKIHYLCTIPFLAQKSKTLIFTWNPKCASYILLHLIPNLSIQIFHHTQSIPITYSIHSRTSSFVHHFLQ